MLPRTRPGHLQNAAKLQASFWTQQSVYGPRLSISLGFHSSARKPLVCTGFLSADFKRLSATRTSAVEPLSIHRTLFTKDIGIVAVKRDINTRNNQKSRNMQHSNSEKTFKHVLKENIYNIPNLLTISRLAITPIIGYFIIGHCYIEALYGLILAGLTDVLDGFIARRYNMSTAFGSALDPLADKILMTTLVISLSSAGLLPFPLAILILGRDVGLIIGTVHIRYKSLQAPRTLKRYFDFSLPSAEVKPPLISKINTFLQLTLMSATLCGPIFGFSDRIAMEFLRRYTVASTTIWSGLHYWYKKDTIKVLHNKDWRK